jgi:hypothetical protein
MQRVISVASNFSKNNKGGTMRKKITTAILLSLAFAVPAFAVEGGGQLPKDQAVSFEQRKADVLKNIDERMARMQEDKACVQAAANQEELKACWVKRQQEMETKRGEMGRRGGPGGPGGPGGQMAPQGK